MEIGWLTAFIDTPRPADAAVDFWLGVTRSTLSARRGPAGQFATLLPELGDAYLRVQDIDAGRAGCHLDLHVDDVHRYADRAVSSGAQLVDDQGDLVVLRSPAGLVFCVVPHDGEQTRPGPVRWPDGRRTLVDQLCIDVAGDELDDEVAYWSELPGWAPRAGALGEFTPLERPAGMPLRLMFQRRGGADPALRAGAHVDLASDDRDAEVAEHLRRGAALVRRTDFWVTLRDPAGREYCVTRRDPATGLLP
jgi:hypothetical protein